MLIRLGSLEILKPMSAVYVQCNYFTTQTLNISKSGSLSVLLSHKQRFCGFLVSVNVEG